MTSSKNFFEKNSKKIIGLIIFLFFCLSLAGAELILSKSMGLGSPVLYDSNQVYGYRPLPNQETKRFSGAQIKINNLSLRAEKDWDPKERKNKILFLGDSVTYGGSYIANHELFSHLVGENLGLEAGNAGVNAWGVENIAALIVDHKFLPAKTYVTVLVEGDFERGLTNIGGLPYWGHSPKYALKELFYYWLAHLNHKRFISNATISKTRKALVNRAAKRLKEMDTFLKSKGFKHFIFITPGRKQILAKENKDQMVLTALSKHKIDTHYMLDHIKVPKDRIDEVYYDMIHLNKLGHEIWADYIAKRIKS